MLEGGEADTGDEGEHEHQTGAEYGERDGGEGGAELATNPRQEHQDPAHLDHATTGYLGTMMRMKMKRVRLVMRMTAHHQLKTTKQPLSKSWIR